MRWFMSIGFVVSMAAAQAGERLESSIVMEASRKEVWKAFTTSESARAWMVAHAEIDLKIGGLMRTNYDPKGKLGDANTIENTILVFDPERMLAMKNTKAPANFPLPKAIASMWSVIYLEDAGPGKTKVTVVGIGYTDDEDSQKLRKYFQVGNDITLARWKKYVEKKAQ